VKAKNSLRSVLIVEEEPSIRNVLYVLLAGLGCEGNVAHSGLQALSMISRESFDAVLLDFRCSDIMSEQVVEKIYAINPKLLGRVLVITGEANQQTLDLIERYSLPHVPYNRIMQELWNRLQTILAATPAVGSAT
jgi:DNA-binding NtrC family response regulator